VTVATRLRWWVVIQVNYCFSEPGWSGRNRAELQIVGESGSADNNDKLFSHTLCLLRSFRDEGNYPFVGREAISEVGCLLQLPTMAGCLLQLPTIGWLPLAATHHGWLPLAATHLWLSASCSYPPLAGCLLQLPTYGREAITSEY
jgi:hypothetical protein